jgi:hypothetical protein
MAADWKKEIAELELAIDIVEANYKLTMQAQGPFNSLKRMRLDLKKLKGELQVYLDKEAMEHHVENPVKKLAD